VVRRFRNCLLHLAESTPIDMYYRSLLTVNWKPRLTDGRSKRHRQDPLEPSHAQPGILSFLTLPWGPFLRENSLI
jgi:hypothetical protein